MQSQADTSVRVCVWRALFAAASLFDPSLVGCLRSAQTLTLRSHHHCRAIRSSSLYPRRQRVSLVSLGPWLFPALSQGLLPQAGGGTRTWPSLASQIWSGGGGRQEGQGSDTPVLVSLKYPQTYAPAHTRVTLSLKTHCWST